MKNLLDSKLIHHMSIALLLITMEVYWPPVAMVGYGFGTSPTINAWLTSPMEAV
jgi:hypothetical protein